MPVVVLAKKDVKIKPKTSVRRVNAKGNGVKHVGRKNLGRKENARPRGSSKLKLDDTDSGSEIYGRKVAWNRNPAERKRRRAVRNDDVGEAIKSPGVRAHSKRTLSPSTKEKSSDVELSRRKPSNRRQRDIDEDESDEEIISGRTAREIRDRSGKKDAIHGSRYSGRKENKSKRLEAEAEKLKRKGKRVGEVKSNEINKGNNEDKVFDKEEKIKDQVDQTVKQKPVRFQARMLDKTGKKIRGHKKPSDDKPEVTEASLKKRKRVIKIDPYDLSNKRLDDGKSSNVHTEKAVEKEIELSKNAQFRAIQPSPSILSFVEDNLLGRRRLMELQNAGYNVKLSSPLDNVPFSTSAERERIEENVFRNKLEFFAAAKISSSFPPPMIPEIAFAGRSNIGKSSLLNALTRQWGVVRTSDKPGHTQTINFFRLASKLCLVDLPGYGFAYAKEEVKDAWEELVKEYVSTRIGLKRVCLLIDTKWGMKPRDHELIDLMERSQTPYQIVLTKTDVAFPIDVARRAMQVQESLKANKLVVNPLMMVSSKSGAGIRSLRTVLAKIARFAKL